MHPIRKRNPVADHYSWIEALRPIRSDGFEPEITVCADVLAKGNVSSPDDPAPWSEAQTGSSKREGHDRARQPIPKTTGDEQQCNSSGVPLKPSGNTVPNLLHCRVVYDRAFLNGSLPKSGARDRCGR